MDTPPETVTTIVVPAAYAWVKESMARANKTYRAKNLAKVNKWAKDQYHRKMLNPEYASIRRARAKAGYDARKKKEKEAEAEYILGIV